MAKGEVKKKIRLLSLGIGLAVVALLASLYLLKVHFLDVVEFKILDSHFRLRGSYDPGDKVVIVAIDEKSLAKLGRWPWPRSIMAGLIDRLSSQGAKVIGVDIIFSEPDENQKLVAAGQLKRKYEELKLAQKGKEERDFYNEITGLMREADTDAVLSQAIKKAGNVVLPLFFTFQEEEAVETKKGDEIQLTHSAFQAFGNFSQRKVFSPFKAGWVTTPLPVFAEGAAALGHVNLFPDSDGTVRWEMLAVEHAGEYYPSFPLQIARTYLGIPQKDMKLAFGTNIMLKDTAVPINEEGRLLINYAGGIRTFKYYSAADVLDGSIPADAFKNKIAVIGASAVGIYDLRVTPFSPVFPGVEKQANVVANVLNQNFLRRPNWLSMVDLAAIAILGLALALFLSRLRPVTGAVLAIAAAGAYFFLSHLLFSYAGIWFKFFYPLLAISGTYFGVTVLRFLTEEKERRFIKGAFQQYVSQEVVEEIVKDPEKLKFGGERKDLTVLFSDIRGFTTFSEARDPEEVVLMLHDYLTAMVDQVFKHGGTVDKFIGDAIMAIWGAPIPQEDHALKACQCALDMMKETENLNAKWEREGRPPFTIGIGINSGEMVVGNLGSAQRFDYTVIGDNVNLAARLEAANKEFDTKLHIIISEFTYEMVKDKVQAEKLASLTVKGKTRPVTIYQLTGTA